MLKPLSILFCFGTRPEAIKMAPLIHEFGRKGISFKVCVTAQHREMLDQVLQFFKLKVDYDLNLMLPGQSLNLLSSRILSAVDEILDKEKPDIVLVHGDTTTSSMIALAAFHRGIKVGHIEAGLRTYNRRAPFPEEMNRQLTARIADFHFAPTVSSKENLLKEQISKQQILVTGNTIVDALQWAIQTMKSSSLNPETLNLQQQIPLGKNLVLVTGHRRENFGKGLEEICKAIKEICEREDIFVIFPVHLNPEVKEPVSEFLSGIRNVLLVPPVKYPTMLWLLKESKLIISDSGGIQEESPAFGKQVLVTRDVTERMEGLEAGYSILVGANRKRILSEATKILDGVTAPPKKDNPYGDGNAAKRIVEFIINLSF